VRGIFQLTQTISCFDVVSRRYSLLHPGVWIICAGNLSKALKVFAQLDKIEVGSEEGLWDSLGTPTAFFTSDGRMKLTAELAHHPERIK